MATTAALSSTPGRGRQELSIVYLYLLRGVYLLIAVGMGIQVWPGIFHHGQIELMRSVTRAMLAGMTLLMLVGVRYPLQMLPLLFFEFRLEGNLVIVVRLAAVLGASARCRRDRLGAGVPLGRHHRSDRHPVEIRIQPLYNPARRNPWR